MTAATARCHRAVDQVVELRTDKHLGIASNSGPELTSQLGSRPGLAAQAVEVVVEQVHRTAGELACNNVVVNGVTITGYKAGPGWDPVTGWGTPDPQVLIRLLAH